MIGGDRVKNHLLLPPVAVLILLSAGCANENDDPDDEDETAAVPVEVVVPHRGNIDAVYSGTAPIEAFDDAVVIAKVAGEIREILVEEGDDVRAGQVLLRLDGDRLRLEMQQAEANLAKLEREYRRNVDLREKGLLSAGDFEKIQYEMEALRASYDLAKLEYGYTEIRAPIAGVVSRRFVKAGNTIDVNAPTFEITSLEPLVSYLHVPEREYRRIGKGQPATIEVDAVSGVRFDATVARVSPVVDPQTGTFKITVEVSDETRRLKPGMFGRISIVYDRRENALQIPRSAVLEDADASSVFVVVDDTAERRAVTLGYGNRGYVEVIDGIGDDDRVVSLGHTGLKNGAKVAVIETAGRDDAPSVAGHGGNR